MLRDLVNSPRIRSLKDKSIQFARTVLVVAAEKTAPLVMKALDKASDIVITLNGRDYTIYDPMIAFLELLEKYRLLYERFYSEGVDVDKLLAQLSEDERKVVKELSSWNALSEQEFIVAILRDFCSKYPKLSKKKEKEVWTMLGRYLRDNRKQ